MYLHSPTGGAELGTQRRTVVTIIDDDGDDCDVNVVAPKYIVPYGQIPSLLLKRNRCNEKRSHHNIFFAVAQRESDDEKFSMTFNATAKGSTAEVPFYLSGIADVGQYNVHVYQVASGGLLGSYFSDFALSKSMPTMQRVDSAVNFTWSQEMASSVRWNGFIKTPDTSLPCCAFHVEADNARLWVNNFLIIDEWHQSVTGSSTSGFYNLGDKDDIHEITLEVRQFNSWPSIKLMWDAENGIDVIQSNYLLFKVRSVEDVVKIQVMTTF